MFTLARSGGMMWLAMEVSAGFDSCSAYVSIFVAVGTAQFAVWCRPLFSQRHTPETISYVLVIFITLCLNNCPHSLPILSFNRI